MAAKHDDELLRMFEMLRCTEEGKQFLQRKFSEAPQHLLEGAANPWPDGQQDNLSEEHPHADFVEYTLSPIKTLRDFALGDQIAYKHRTNLAGSYGTCVLRTVSVSEIVYHHAIVSDVSNNSYNIINLITRNNGSLGSGLCARGEVTEDTKRGINENSVYKVNYKNKNICLAVTEVIKRARAKIGEKNFNFFTDNCEHFASWCKTGVKKSMQRGNCSCLDTLDSCS